MYGSPLSRRHGPRALLGLTLAAFALASRAALGAPLDLAGGGQRLLDDVNRGVNRGFEPLAAFPDPNGDGVWDCENYAAEKRARLARAGVPLDDLSLWRVTTTRGQSHAVLVVKAQRGGRVVELVLDNLSQWAAPRAALPYTGWAPLAVDDRAAVTSATPSAAHSP
jgi:predicted transglutaminase-like cysteine proteinase